MPQKPNLYDVYSRLGTIEGKLDSTLGSLKEHDKRINDVEKVQDQMVGKISIISSVFGFIGGIIITILRVKL